MTSEARNVTRAHLAEAVCRATGLPKAEAASFVELFIDLITDRILAGEQVLISGFGKFVVLKRAARKGRNVKLGVNVPIAPRFAVVFKPAPKLVASLNGAPARKRTRSAPSEQERPALRA